MKIQLLALITISLISSSVFADFQCYAKDAGGHMWSSAGSTQDRATAVAMSFCSSFSPDGSSCQPAQCTSK